MWNKYQQLHADSTDLSVQAHGAGRILNINFYWVDRSQSRINFYQFYQIIHPTSSDPECYGTWQKHKHETQKYMFLLSAGKISLMHSKIYPAVPANEAEHSQWLRKACTGLQLYLAEKLTAYSGK